MARALKEGYTLLVTGSSSFDANPSLCRNAGFNPTKDFEPIALIATGAYLLVANRSFPPSTVSELVAFAKANPGKVFYGSVGNGTPNHRVGEVLKQRAGVDMTPEHVGSGPLSTEGDLAVHALCLQGAEETLHCRVVPDPASAAHACLLRRI